MDDTKAIVGMRICLDTVVYRLKHDYPDAGWAEAVLRYIELSLEILHTVEIDMMEDKDEQDDQG